MESVVALSCVVTQAPPNNTSAAPMTSILCRIKACSFRSMRCCQTVRSQLSGEPRFVRQPLTDDRGTPQAAHQQHGAQPHSKRSHQSLLSIAVHLSLPIAFQRVPRLFACADFLAPCYFGAGALSFCPVGDEAGGASSTPRRATGGTSVNQNVPFSPRRHYYPTFYHSSVAHKSRVFPQTARILSPDASETSLQGHNKIRTWCTNSRTVLPVWLIEYILQCAM